MSVRVAGEPVEQRPFQALRAQHAGPLFGRQVRRHDGRAALVALREDLVQNLSAGRRLGRAAEFIDDQQPDAHQLRLQARQPTAMKADALASIIARTLAAPCANQNP